MKVSPTKAIIWIVGITLLSITILYGITGIFSVFISLLILTLTGLFYGVIKKEKRLWKPFLFAFILTLAGASIFFYLLSVSKI